MRCRVYPFVTSVILLGCRPSGDQDRFGRDGQPTIESGDRGHTHAGGEVHDLPQGGGENANDQTDLKMRIAVLEAELVAARMEAQRARAVGARSATIDPDSGESLTVLEHARARDDAIVGLRDQIESLHRKLSESTEEVRRLTSELTSIRKRCAALQEENRRLKHPRAPD